MGLRRPFRQLARAYRLMNSDEKMLEFALRSSGSKGTYWLKKILDKETLRRLAFEVWKSEQQVIGCGGANGFRWVGPTYDVPIITELYAEGAFDKEEIEIFFALAEKYGGSNKTGAFCDIGANIGTTCIVANSYITAESPIYAFEPSSDNFTFLKANIVLNGLEDRIVAVKAAISSEDGVATIALSNQNSGDHRVLHESGSEGEVVDAELSAVKQREVESVKQYSLTSYFANNKDYANIRYFWIDTQGFEYYVLKGAEGVLDANPEASVVIEFWPLGLRCSGSLEKTCDFIVEKFSHYIDIFEYIAGKEILHEVKDIHELVRKIDASYDAKNAPEEYRHTNLFLIRNH